MTRTVREFEASARKFVVAVLRKTYGKTPSRVTVEEVTAKLVKSFKFLLHEELK